METLETDQAVTLVTTNFRQTSIGMFVDLTTEEIFFHRAVVDSAQVFLVR